MNLCSGEAEAFLLMTFGPNFKNEMRGMTQFLLSSSHYRSELSSLWEWSSCHWMSSQCIGGRFHCCPSPNIHNPGTAASSLLGNSHCWDATMGSTLGMEASTSCSKAGSFEDRAFTIGQVLLVDSHGSTSSTITYDAIPSEIMVQEEVLSGSQPSFTSMVVATITS